MSKTLLLLALITVMVSAKGQVFKYQSTNYDIEKPGVSGYETINEISNHIFDFNNNVVTIQKFKGEGGDRKAYYVKKYTIKAISEESLYYLLSISNNGVDKIFLPKGSGGNMEYDFSNGIHWVFYDLTRYK